MQYFDLPKGITEDEIRKITGQGNLEVLRGLRLRYLYKIRRKSAAEILNMPIAKTNKGESMSRQNLYRILNSPLFDSIENILDKFTSN